MDSQHLTVEEASNLLGVSVATVRRWAATKRLIAHKDGGQWLIDRRTLPARSSRGRRRSTPSPTIDLETALKQVRSTDLKELWVPDLLRFEDDLRDNELLARASAKVNGLSAFAPPTMVEIPKTPFFTRWGTMLPLEDRIAFHGLVRTLQPSVEHALPGTVFSARQSESTDFLFLKGRNQWLKWRKAARDLVECGFTYMITTDVTAFFDTIQHRMLFADIDSHSASDEAASAIKRALTVWSTAPGLGIPQGPDASRLLGNLFLIPVDQELSTGAFRYLRYMDDIRVFGRTRREAIEGIREVERACRARGLVLSARKTQLLVGEKAEAALRDDDLDALQYDIESGAHATPAKELRNLLKKALATTSVDSRRTKFALWRLRSIRDRRGIRQVMRRLEDLAHLASIVAAYVQPFVDRTSVQRDITTFLDDPDRNTSHFLSAWMLATVLDARTPIPRALLHYCRTVARDRNLPTYHRGLAANVLSLGGQAIDINWMRQVARESHEPQLIRAAMIGLARAGQFDRGTARSVETRFPDLERTSSYLRGGKSLPSLIYAGQRTSIAGR